MRARRVRVQALQEGSVRLMGPEAHPLARVLRARVGDPVQGFDGTGREADGVIAAVMDGTVEVSFGPPRVAGVEAPIAVTLAVALLKGDKLSQVVRQATELGAQRVRPIVTARCDVPRLSPSKADRLRRVATEAAKQSGRAQVPEVDDPVALSALAWDGPAWIADPGAEQGWADMDLEPALAAGRATLLTGPEGGFTAAELKDLVARGARPIRMGARVLRAETAPLALLTALLSRIDE